MMFTWEQRDLCLVHVNRHLVLGTLSKDLDGHSQAIVSDCLHREGGNENSYSGFLGAEVRLVSSAYILTSDRRLQFGRSLMYGRNNRRPRIEAPHNLCN